MPKYRVWFQSTASFSLEIESDSTDKSEIIDQAYEDHRYYPTLCHQCAGGWGGSDRPGLDISDAWEATDQDVELVEE